MELNPDKRELALKFVYYGPGLSGKTTNLRALFQTADPRGRGRLMTVDTADDRTLFFDLLPLFLQTSSGLKVKLKLFTVPGQVMHNSTRRLVLAGADAVAFIADAQPGERQANFDYWRNLGENLRENGISTENLPLVIQFNKCDLADGALRQEIAETARNSRRPVFAATAIRGEGVKETFSALVSLTLERLDREHGLARSTGLDLAELLGSLARTLEGSRAGGPR